MNRLIGCAPIRQFFFVLSFRITICLVNTKILQQMLKTNNYIWKKMSFNLKKQMTVKNYIRQEKSIFVQNITLFPDIVWSATYS